ncbi:MAG: aldolase [Candidatus Kerfeldbacteria bacterium CG_4_10_14_0_8_um_filter_42_10]|uniref:fructose-bisphosphate aldolase n=1 Tax=Candidatus Kerfeldbacteria bacterium CG_4_10_14_0_8_um_filter_42_10 TaxID=2014248 RepID=A0A2M7RIU8_9BACT|nr:MAG: aldolase [Candidatus Kerfeldbacteria bacterium CG_4_10_14_0_8_um_filter_42_10]
MSKLKKLTPSDVLIPANIPTQAQKIYVDNFLKVTKGTGRLMAMAGDQKVEHLNDDFCGKDIAPEDNDPEHLFRIASGGTIGLFATQYGMITKYGLSYPKIPYLVKLNSKTHLVETEQKDPLSRQWLDFHQVIELKENSGLDIVGVGFTVYSGSEYEDIMLQEAATLITEAHMHGLISIIWSYPRGKAVPNEKDPHLIAGAAGLALTLGADFVKINYPKPTGGDPSESLKEATQAAGRTGVIISGGSSIAPIEFLKQMHDVIHVGGCRGTATGRNVHQKSLKEAINMTNALSAITYNDATVEEAFKIYEGKEEFKMNPVRS